jgi:molecular chaperone DnaK
MSEIVGIDLGTTNSLIGLMDSGFPVLIADKEGSRLTPSVIYFPEKGNPIVGSLAHRMRVLEPERTVYSVKRLIGRRPGESEKENLPFTVKSIEGRMMLESRFPA